MEDIAERLSTMDNLYFPRAIQPLTNTPPQRKSLLLDLLTKDTAVFLERYGTQLTNEELDNFNQLNEDYEVNWHVKNLRSLLNPTSEEVKSRSVRVKNRRRAYMDKLVLDGNYFSEDAMREREPYLHHEYLGKFQDPSGRSMARPGERWSDTLMRRCEEAVLVQKIRGEQQRLGVDEKEWVGNPVREEEEQEEEEEEEEEEDEEDSEGEKKPMEGIVHENEMTANAVSGIGEHSNCTESDERPTLSPAEMQDQIEQFTHIMQQKFLSGEDSQHLDYSKIDNDETLDDHWFREANHDAEEKYFADD